MTQLLSLANELLHLIAENLYNPRDIAALVLTNRRLASILTPHLHSIALEDKHGINALHWAAKQGYEPLIQLILDSGRDVNLRDHNRQTPLHLAAANGHEGAVATLLRNGADIDARDENEDTPLHSAAYASQISTVRALLDHGADPDTPGMQSNTPIHRTVQGGKGKGTIVVEIVQLLLDRGADITLMNQVDRQAYFYVEMEIWGFFARVTGHVDYLHALQAYMEANGPRGCHLVGCECGR